MTDFSVLIGGKAGFGIDTAGTLIAKVLNQLGYRLYIYRDYPSLIRGGHTFSVIRASKERISCHKSKVEFVLALNQDTLDLHLEKLEEGGVLIFDSDTVKLNTQNQKFKAVGISLAELLKEVKASEIMRNSCILGAFFKISSIPWDIVETVFKKNVLKETELNIKTAKLAFEKAETLINIERLNQKTLPIISGNEAIAMGLIKAGLGAYVAYPMTPSSSILHFLAQVSDKFALKVIHPESEIAVILMALGFSYAGVKCAVGTSGGGFCLMSEGLSFSGMSELPVVIVMGQRPGPSTGLPTYTSQADLNFVLSAGQGEFTRLVVAPSDAEDAYLWAGRCLNLSWKFQIPAILLSDKTLSEGAYNFEETAIDNLKEEDAKIWDRNGTYKRYKNDDTYVSPLAFPPDANAVVKINSYEHDEFGITTEDSLISKAMQEKRIKKEVSLEKELMNYNCIQSYGDKNNQIALICWGSNKGICFELARELNIRAICPTVLNPFLHQQFAESLGNATKLICIENNATSQLADLLKKYDFKVSAKIVKYDGRPFALEELREEVKKYL